MTSDNAIIYNRAGLADQGKLGPLLLAVYGPVLSVENAAAAKAAFPGSSLEDELMAADDFYFSTIDLMDCCYFAHVDSVIVGAACLNPYVAELQYVAVLPEWRRKGIAGTLVNLAMQEAHKRGLDHLRADASLTLADNGGSALLSSLGFTEIRRATTMGRSL